MSEQFLLGWEEWLALPELGLAAIKAKIDTGARTSALHAFTVESFGPVDKPKVRFGVHPIPGRDDIEVFCTADVVDRREVTSSNGESDLRYVVRTTVAMGARTWPIEITLANREAMAYRMLLGRQAIQEDMFVDATTSFRQPKLSYRGYKAPARTPEAQRPLKIALITRRPENPSNRRILRAAEGRGHQTVVVERTRLSLLIDAREPALFLDGRPLADVDAVIVRSGRVLNAFSLAAVRQLEILGAYAINPRRCAGTAGRAVEPAANTGACRCCGAGSRGQPRRSAQGGQARGTRARGHVRVTRESRCHTVRGCWWPGDRRYGAERPDHARHPAGLAALPR